jgi:hypothetical protein
MRQTNNPIILLIGVQPGRMIILPSTFAGSPRNMHQNFQDGMAVVRKHGSPHLFLTFTCNSACREVQQNLGHHQRAENRPDLIARVFALHFKEFHDDLTRKHVLGHMIAWLYVVEFQKRGLPHIHFLGTLCAEDVPRDRFATDRIVCAEIPDRTVNPALYEIVRKNMTHGPCGSLNPMCVCMADGKCTKHFPKSFCEETKENVNGYPEYRRRNDGRTVTVRGKELDNRWIVPYNPCLSLKYGAHINVEICMSIKSVKYLYKYVNKGPDSATVAITQLEAGAQLQVDEITNFIDTRYVWKPVFFTLSHTGHLSNFCFHSNISTSNVLPH